MSYLECKLNMSVNILLICPVSTLFFLVIAIVFKENIKNKLDLLLHDNVKSPKWV